MSEEPRTSQTPSSLGRMVLPTLFIAQMTSDTPPFIASLLLIEIGQTFGSPIGITRQINIDR